MVLSTTVKRGAYSVPKKKWTDLKAFMEETFFDGITSQMTMRDFVGAAELLSGREIPSHGSSMDRRSPFIVSAMAADVHGDICGVDGDITSRETDVTDRERCDKITTLLVVSLVNTRTTTT